MTLIPSDPKDAQQSATPSHIEEGLLDINNAPPAYSETDTSSVAGSTSLPASAPIRKPGFKTPLSPPEKVPESNGISASHSVNLEGPLHILGAVKGSSSVTLSNHVTVEGKVSSSSSVVLDGTIVVVGKVDASGSVKLRNNVDVSEKVDASGSIDVTIDGGEKGIHILGSVKSSGKTEIKGWVQIDGDVRAMSSLKLQGYGPPGSKYQLKIAGKIEPSSSCTIDGDVEVQTLSVHGALTLNGRLHVLGDLEVHGQLILLNGSDFVVDGRRTIHGSIVKK